MANPTTNYGFVLPTSTDLVTDLPADFDVALQGVDTRLKALQPGTTLGDLAYSSATANTNTRLAVGSNGTVLTVAAGVPSWAAPAGTPTGTVIFYAANTAPTGFLKANGAAVSRSTYAALFSAIGTTFGAGDGSTTFLLPDLRGYFPRGWADDGSIDSGRTFGTTQAATNLGANPSNKTRAVDNVTENSDGSDGSVSAINALTSGGETATLTKQRFRPVNIALLAAIKF